MGKDLAWPSSKFRKSSSLASYSTLLSSSTFRNTERLGDRGSVLVGRQLGRPRHPIHRLFGPTTMEEEVWLLKVHEPLILHDLGDQAFALF